MSLFDIDKIISYAERRGADHVDVLFQKMIYEAIVLDNGVLREYSINRINGIGVRVIIDGSEGFSSTNKPGVNSVYEAVDEAIKIANAMKHQGVKTRLAERSVNKDKVVSPYNKEVLEIDPADKQDILKKVYSVAKSVESIVSVITRFGYELDQRIYASSLGDYVEKTTRLVGIGVYAIAKTGEVMERVWDSKSKVAGWEFIEETDWEKFAKETAELASKASRAPVVKPGKYIAILDNMIVGLMLHEAFGHATEGDIVESGASILAGKKGSKVASELVTIYDDGLVRGGYYYPYDDEGTRKNKIATVEKGILKGFLHSRSTAYNLQEKPTGNARTMDFSSPYLVRQTNTYMAPGDWKVEELFEDVKEGIYIKGKGSMGGQVDTSMGTFTFTAGPSYLIKNGEPVKLVRGVMMSGMILETLKNIDAVANDLVVRTSVFGACGKGGQHVRVGDGGPHVRVKELTIGSGR